MSRPSTSISGGALAIMLSLAALSRFAPIAATAQDEVTDAEIERVGGGWTIAIGSLAGDRAVSRLPLEVYVARVLAGEAEQNAPDGELQALAIAIRTYAVFNVGRHGRDGFDLCDTTHCQVMRAATAATRRAVLATSGQILTWNDAPAEVFYSASCGGRSESAAAVWPGANLPYLKSVKDDVHDDDVPWIYDVRLRDVERILLQHGFAGERLKDLRVASHTPSGRVASLRLSGLDPDVIAGDQFRLLIGARDIKSTAFGVERLGDRLEFTGRGYGHGVGMCVIGAGRRARRGETVRQILAQYYPGLQITPLERVATRLKRDTLLASSASDRREPAAAPAIAPAPVLAVPPAPSASIAVSRSLVTIRGAGTATAELEQTASRVQQTLARRLGIPASALTIDVHDTVEGFRQATGKPWWVSVSVNGTAVDLAPPPLLVQRDGVETTLGNALAQAMMASTFEGRAEWVRVGAARYFSRMPPLPAPGPKTKIRCPADAELTLAISATAQREAESRAEACFARAYAASHDWRLVK